MRQWLSRDRLFLVAGVAGLAAAALGAIGAPRVDALGLGAAAVVDGRPIPREAVVRAVEALATDKRNRVTKADEALALERLIDEEVLVQRGVALGLAETDLAARKAIVQSVLQLAVAERAGAEPSDGELRRFYRDNAAMFTAAPRVRATLAFVRRESGEARRAAVEAALRAGRPANGDPVALELPHDLLTPGELRTYLGSAFAAEALAAHQGDVLRSETVDGWRLLRIDATAPSPNTGYEAVADQVRAEWDRRADETAVRDYVARLKRSARISRSP